MLRLVNVLPFAGPAPVVKGRYQADGIELRGNKVGQGAEHTGWCPVRPAGDGVKSRECGQDESLSVVPGQRSGMPVHAGTQHDDIRLYFLKIFIVKPPFFHGSGGKAISHDICPGN